MTDLPTEPDPFAPGTAVWVYEVPGGYLVTPKTPELSETERARLDAMEAAEPAPESWAIVQRNLHRLHLHNGEPCCLADADGQPIGPACGTAWDEQ